MKFPTNLCNTTVYEMQNEVALKLIDSIIIMGQTILPEFK